MGIRLFNIMATVLIGAFVAMGCSSDENEYEIFGTLSGIVTDYSTGEPISNATVTLSPGNQSVLSDMNGTFTFADIDAQTCTITIQKEGYQVNRKNVTVISGEPTSVNIPLTRIPQ